MIVNQQEDNTMAKNLEITLEMLKKHNACISEREKFKEIFGDKVVINKNNIIKAAEELEMGERWVYNLLMQPYNRVAYTNFIIASERQWKED